MAPRQSPLDQKKIREALTPKAPKVVDNDPAAPEDGNRAKYEVNRLKKMNRG
jgi:hypothetical protein